MAVLCSIGLLTKRFTEALDALDPRPYHALLAMGVRPLPAICHSVLPQLKPVFTSIILYRFDVNIREASVLGLVGAGGIGAPLIFSMNQYAWEKAGAIMLGLIRWWGLSIWYLKKSELEIDGQLRFSVFWILFKKSFKPRREISKDFQWIFSFCYFSNFL